MGHIRVPELVRQQALANGAAGARWLEALPAVVRSLAARWDLEVGEAFAGGTASYVAAAADSEGREVVLKVAMVLGTDDAALFERSVAVHGLAGGRGCVVLLDHDEDRFAMLLERLGPDLDALGMPVPQLLEAVAATLREFWRPRTPGVELPSGADQAGRLARHIERTWEALGRPCERAVVDRALDLCERRAAELDPTSCVLVHGDAHGWNTLAAEEGHYRLVDPEGLWSEPEHDLGVLLREYNLPLLAGDTAPLVRARAEQLAVACEADPERIEEWGFIERVSTGLASLQAFDGDGGLAFLEVARRCL
ncbi:MAG TPA: aminoglycoside phosphotransferase family protein [Acidimicrobiales bacterium]|nr:aminoglycoside phosphotransferase family protein [Acidimicrobiales bacterium]